MNYLLGIAKRLSVEEDGTTAVEYAVMLALILIACIAAILSTGDVQKQLFEDTGSDLGDAMYPN